MKALIDFVREHKAGRGNGVYSVCSAHPVVLEAALRQARARGETVLIEATSNQVNQLGGYTGMTPRDFRAQVEALAAAAGAPMERVLLGGDHLGPNAWQAEPAAAAMDRAAAMVSGYVAAGFRKIHLDCSMACADDPVALSDERIAARAAELCTVAERAWREAGGEPPVYVIGTEVPKPGGATEALEALAVTAPDAVDRTLDAHRRAFAARGLEAAWQRIVALVVQPGVEFDNDKVVAYSPAAARSLSRRIVREPGIVYEAHSTDYQTAASLRALVEDHFAILKVGPAATFALRETLWALADVAREWRGGEAGGLKETVLAAMAADPRHWKAHYHDAARRRYDLQFSLSDRIRYYWSQPGVRAAVDALFGRLGEGPLPLALLSQYLPCQHEAVREGRLANAPREILLDGVAAVLRRYSDACRAPATAPHAGAPEAAS